MFARVAWLGLPLSSFVACATSRAPATQAVPTVAPRTEVAPAPPPAPVPALESGIRFFVDPPDARLLVNGRDLGGVAQLGGGVVRLAPGLYRVTLRREGFETWRAEVAVRGGFERLQVSLVRQSP